MTTDTQIIGIIKTVGLCVNTCPDLKDCEVKVSHGDKVIHDGNYHGFSGTVIIDGVEWSLTLERFDD